MSIRTLTLSLPDALYSQLKQRAEHAYRTTEEEAVDVLASAIPVAERRPADLAETVAALFLLDDEALWRAARNRLGAEVSAQIEELHLKRQREGLSEVEDQGLSSLMRQYERVLLVRAHAAALLKQRGQDMSELLTKP
jgi:plasmid stability protein